MIGNPGVNPTERAFSPQTVCVPATGVYMARAVLGHNPAGSIPGTKAEVLALAVDMGTPGGVGANFTKLKAALLKRYGLTSTVFEGAAAANPAVRAAYIKGPCVVGLAGDQLNLHPHWQTGSVGHAICVLYPFGSMGIQLDPLAPAHYQGDSFSESERLKFSTAAIIIPIPATASDCAVEVKAATDAMKLKLKKAAATAIEQALT